MPPVYWSFTRRITDDVLELWTTDWKMAEESLPLIDL